MLQLLYFCIAPDSYNGFMRALSVASRTHMPRIPKKNVPEKLSDKQRFNMTLYYC